MKKNYDFSLQRSLRATLWGKGKLALCDLSVCPTNLPSVRFSAVASELMRSILRANSSTGIFQFFEMRQKKALFDLRWLRFSL